MYKYNYRWFHGSEIERYLLNFMDTTKVHNILEIGCFEGLSSVFFADNILDHPNSALTCVDPFLTIENNDHVPFSLTTAEQHFDHNIRICKNSNKITVHKITSDKFFETNTTTYNFIYIDGCHEPDFITRDMENAFRVLDVNGIMWMDDYGGGDGVQIRNTMNAFLDKHRGEYRLLHSGYQLALVRITYDK